MPVSDTCVFCVGKGGGGGHGEIVLFGQTGLDLCSEYKLGVVALIKCQFCPCLLQRNVESPEWSANAHPLVVRNTRDITKAMHLCASIIRPQEHADEDPLDHKVHKVLALLCEQGEDQRAAVEVGAARFLQAHFKGGEDGEMENKDVHVNQMEKKDEGSVHMSEEESEEEEDERRSRPASRLSSRASSGSSSSSSSGSRSSPRTPHHASPPRPPPALQPRSPLPPAPSPTPPSPQPVSALLTEQKVIITLWLTFHLNGVCGNSTSI